MGDRERISFFVWLLPALCGTCSYIHHYYPGDENAMWLLGSVPGLWVAPIIFLGGFSKAVAAVYIALAVAAVLLVVGWVMDRFQVRRAFWAIAFPVSAMGVLAVSVLSDSSVERAISRNGSWWSYVLLSINLGAYLSVVVAVLLTAVARGWGLANERLASTDSDR